MLFVGAFLGAVKTQWTLIVRAKGTWSNAVKRVEEFNSDEAKKKSGPTRKG